MKSSTLLLAAISVAQASAQLDFLQSILNPVVRDIPKVNPEDRIVHEITIDNWRAVLQDSSDDWLALFTAGPENCPGCVRYDKTFNDSAILLEDYKNIHFGRINCDNDPLLCSLFSSWGSRIFHITHTDEPSTAATTDGAPLIHRTHLRSVPFHRPGSEPVVFEDAEGKSTKPTPPPDATWVNEVIRNEKWKEIEEWDGYSQPFDGWAKEGLYLGWWMLTWFSKIPPYVTMLGIGIFSRLITGRFMGKTAHVPRRTTAPAAAGAKK